MAKSKNVGRIGNIPFDEKAALKKMEESQKKMRETLRQNELRRLKEKKARIKAREEDVKLRRGDKKTYDKHLRKHGIDPEEVRKEYQMKKADLEARQIGNKVKKVAKVGSRLAAPVGVALGAIEAAKLAKEAIGDPFISDGTLMSKKITKRKDPETGRSVEELSIRPVSSRIKEPLSELEEASRRGRMASLGRGMAMKKGGKVPNWQDHVKAKYGK